MRSRAHICILLSIGFVPEIAIARLNPPPPKSNLPPDFVSSPPPRGQGIGRDIAPPRENDRPTARPIITMPNMLIEAEPIDRAAGQSEEDEAITGFGNDALVDNSLLVDPAERLR